MKFSIRRAAFACLLLGTGYAPAQTLTQIRDAGPRATRLNVVFFGDGYTAAEQAKFQGDAATHLQVMLDNESWSRFAGVMNGFAIYTVSNESGADEPGATTPVFRDTYFGSSFWTSGIERLLTIASGANGSFKVNALLQQFVPDYDVFVILVNSTKYGGAGGPYPTTSLNTQSREVLLHELGHSFALLTDEYVEEGIANNYPAREYPNATQTTTRAASPWRDFIPLTTIFPTTIGPDENTVGHFAGAHYRQSFFRPTFNSKMLSLNRPFGPVNLRAFGAKFHALNLEGATASPTLAIAPTGASVVTGQSHTLQAQGAGAGPLTYQWRKDGVYVPTGNAATLPLTAMSAAQAGVYSVEVTNARGTTTSADVVLALSTSLGLAGSSIFPAHSAVTAGQNVTLSATFSAPPSSYQWRRNGTAINGAGSSSFTISNVQPSAAGMFVALPANGLTWTFPAIVGVSTTAKVIGTGTEVGPNILHSNGNTYDQVLLTGIAATVTADPGQVLRMSFVDLSNDIVQVEFSGAGNLTLILESSAGLPAPPAFYNQPGVSYMKGHPSIVVTGANETTHLSVFSVGRVTAVNQTLFRDEITYDGMADVGFVAIASSNGRFGGLRTGNVSYFGTAGFTGLYAPGVDFGNAPVYLGDISASSAATPVLVIGGGTDVRITGGDLQQINHRAIQADGLTHVQMTSGTNSHGAVQAAQPLRGRLERNGTDITEQVR